MKEEKKVEPKERRKKKEVRKKCAKKVVIRLAEDSNRLVSIASIFPSPDFAQNKTCSPAMDDSQSGLPNTFSYAKILNSSDTTITANASKEQPQQKQHQQQPTPVGTQNTSTASSNNKTKDNSRHRAMTKPKSVVTNVEVKAKEEKENETVEPHDENDDFAGFVQVVSHNTKKDKKTRQLKPSGAGTGTATITPSGTNNNSRDSKPKSSKNRNNKAASGVSGDGSADKTATAGKGNRNGRDKKAATAQTANSGKNSNANNETKDSTNPANDEQNKKVEFVEAPLPSVNPWLKRENLTSQIVLDSEKSTDQHQIIKTPEQGGNVVKQQAENKDSMAMKTGKRGTNAKLFSEQIKIVDAYDWPTLGSEGDIKQLKKENPVLAAASTAAKPQQKDKVEVANHAKAPPATDDIQVSSDASEKPKETANEVPKAPVVESIVKVNNVNSTPTVNVHATAPAAVAAATTRSNPIVDDKVKFQPVVPQQQQQRVNHIISEAGPRHKEHNNSTKSRWNRYEDDKPSSMPQQPPPIAPQQPSRIRQERDDRHATSNRTYGQSNSNRYTRSSQAPSAQQLTHSTAITNGKPISNHRNSNGYTKRSDDIPANNSSSNSNYQRTNRNAKQLIGQVLINAAVPAPIPYAAAPFYYYSNPIIDTVASIKESIKRQIEYYFSEENLNRDFFLRRKMDPEGYLPVTLIASFNRVIALSADLALIIAAVKESDKLEVYNDYKVRTKIDPTKWPLSATDSNPPISNVPEKSYMVAKHAPATPSSSTSTLSSAALASNEFYPAGYENGDISTTASVVPLSNVLVKIPPPPVLKNAKKKPTTGSTNASEASTTTPTASGDTTNTTTTNNNSKVDNNNTSSSVQPLQMAVVCK